MATEADNQEPKTETIFHKASSVAEPDKQFETVLKHYEVENVKEPIEGDNIFKSPSVGKVISSSSELSTAVDLCDEVSDNLDKETEGQVSESSNVKETEGEPPKLSDGKEAEGHHVEKGELNSSQEIQLISEETVGKGNNGGTENYAEVDESELKEKKITNIETVTFEDHISRASPEEGSRQPSSGTAEKELHNASASEDLRSNHEEMERSGDTKEEITNNEEIECASPANVTLKSDYLSELNKEEAEKGKEITAYPGMALAVEHTDEACVTGLRSDEVSSSGIKEIASLDGRGEKEEKTINTEINLPEAQRETGNEETIDASSTKEKQPFDEKNVSAVDLNEEDESHQNDTAKGQQDAPHLVHETEAYEGTQLSVEEPKVIHSIDETNRNLDSSHIVLPPTEGEPDTALSPPCQIDADNLETKSRLVVNDLNEEDEVHQYETAKGQQDAPLLVHEMATEADNQEPTTEKILQKTSRVTEPDEHLETALEHYEAENVKEPIEGDNIDESPSVGKASSEKLPSLSSELNTAIQISDKVEVSENLDGKETEDQVSKSLSEKETEGELPNSSDGKETEGNHVEKGEPNSIQEIQLITEETVGERYRGHNGGTEKDDEVHESELKEDNKIENLTNTSITLDSPEMIINTGIEPVPLKSDYLSEPNKEATEKGEEMNAYPAMALAVEPIDEKCLTGFRSEEISNSGIKEISSLDGQAEQKEKAINTEINLPEAPRETMKDETLDTSITKEKQPIDEKNVSSVDLNEEYESHQNDTTEGQQDAPPPVHETEASEGTQLSVEEPKVMHNIDEADRKLDKSDLGLPLTEGVSDMDLGPPCQIDGENLETDSRLITNDLREKDDIHPYDTTKVQQDGPPIVHETEASGGTQFYVEEPKVIHNIDEADRNLDSSHIVQPPIEREPDMGLAPPCQIDAGNLETKSKLVTSDLNEEDEVHQYETAKGQQDTPLLVHEMATEADNQEPTTETILQKTSRVTEPDEHLETALQHYEDENVKEPIEGDNIDKSPSVGKASSEKLPSSSSELNTAIQISDKAEVSENLDGKETEDQVSISSSGKETEGELTNSSDGKETEGHHVEKGEPNSIQEIQLITEETVGERYKAHNEGTEKDAEVYESELKEDKKVENLTNTSIVLDSTEMITNTGIEPVQLKSDYLSEPNKEEAEKGDETNAYPAMALAVEPIDETCVTGFRSEEVSNEKQPIDEKNVSAVDPNEEDESHQNDTAEGKEDAPPLVHEIKASEGTQLSIEEPKVIHNIDEADQNLDSSHLGLPPSEGEPDMALAPPCEIDADNLETKSRLMANDLNEEDEVHLDKTDKGLQDSPPLVHEMENEAGNQEPRTETNVSAVDLNEEDESHMNDNANSQQVTPPLVHETKDSEGTQLSGQEKNIMHNIDEQDKKIEDNILGLPLSGGASDIDLAQPCQKDAPPLVHETEVPEGNQLSAEEPKVMHVIDEADRNLDSSHLVLPLNEGASDIDLAQPCQKDAPPLVHETEVPEGNQVSAEEPKVIHVIDEADRNLDSSHLVLPTEGGPDMGLAPPCQIDVDNLETESRLIANDLNEEDEIHLYETSKDQQDALPLVNEMESKYDNQEPTTVTGEKEEKAINTEINLPEAPRETRIDEPIDASSPKEKQAFDEKNVSAVDLNEEDESHRNDTAECQQDAPPLVHETEASEQDQQFVEEPKFIHDINEADKKHDSSDLAPPLVERAFDMDLAPPCQIDAENLGTETKLTETNLNEKDEIHLYDPAKDAPPQVHETEASEGTQRHAEEPTVMHIIDEADQNIYSSDHGLPQTEGESGMDLAPPRQIDVDNLEIESRLVTNDLNDEDESHLCETDKGQHDAIPLVHEIEASEGSQFYVEEPKSTHDKDEEDNRLDSSELRQPPTEGALDTDLVSLCQIDANNLETESRLMVNDLKEEDKIQLHHTTTGQQDAPPLVHEIKPSEGTQLTVEEPNVMMHNIDEADIKLNSNDLELLPIEEPSDIDLVSPCQIDVANVETESRSISNDQQEEDKIQLNDITNVQQEAPPVIQETKASEGIQLSIKEPKAVHNIDEADRKLDSSDIGLPPAEGAPDMDLAPPRHVDAVNLESESKLIASDLNKEDEIQLQDMAKGQQDFPPLDHEIKASEGSQLFVEEPKVMHNTDEEDRKPDSSDLGLPLSEEASDMDLAPPCQIDDGSLEIESRLTTNYLNEEDKIYLQDTSKGQQDAPPLVHEIDPCEGTQLSVEDPNIIHDIDEADRKIDSSDLGLPSTDGVSDMDLTPPCQQGTPPLVHETEDSEGTQLNVEEPKIMDGIDVGSEADVASFGTKGIPLLDERSDKQEKAKNTEIILPEVPTEAGNDENIDASNTQENQPSDEKQNISADDTTKEQPDAPPLIQETEVCEDNQISAREPEKTHDVNEADPIPHYQVDADKAESEIDSPKELHINAESNTKDKLQQNDADNETIKEETNFNSFITTPTAKITDELNIQENEYREDSQMEEKSEEKTNLELPGHEETDASNKEDEEITSITDKEQILQNYPEALTTEESKKTNEEAGSEYENTKLNSPNKEEVIEDESAASVREKDLPDSPTTMEEVIKTSIEEDKENGSQIMVEHRDQAIKSTNFSDEAKLESSYGEDDGKEENVEICISPEPEQIELDSLNTELPTSRVEAANEIIYQENEDSTKQKEFHTAYTVDEAETNELDGLNNPLPTSIAEAVEESQEIIQENEDSTKPEEINKPEEIIILEKESKEQNLDETHHIADTEAEALNPDEKAIPASSIPSPTGTVENEMPGEEHKSIAENIPSMPDEAETEEEFSSTRQSSDTEITKELDNNDCKDNKMHDRDEEQDYLILKESASEPSESKPDEASKTDETCKEMSSISESDVKEHWDRTYLAEQASRTDASCEELPTISRADVEEHNDSSNLKTHVTNGNVEIMEDQGTKSVEHQIDKTPCEYVEVNHETFTNEPSQVPEDIEKNSHIIQTPEDKEDGTLKGLHSVSEADIPSHEVKEIGSSSLQSIDTIDSNDKLEEVPVLLAKNPKTDEDASIIEAPEEMNEGKEQVHDLQIRSLQNIEKNDSDEKSEERVLQPADDSNTEKESSTTEAEQESTGEKEHVQYMSSMPLLNTDTMDLNEKSEDIVLHLADNCNTEKENSSTDVSKETMGEKERTKDMSNMIFEKSEETSSQNFREEADDELVKKDPSLEDVHVHEKTFHVYGTDIEDKNPLIINSSSEKDEQVEIKQLEKSSGPAYQTEPSEIKEIISERINMKTPTEQEDNTDEIQENLQGIEEISGINDNVEDSHITSIQKKDEASNELQETREGQELETLDSIKGTIHKGEIEGAGAEMSSPDNNCLTSESSRKDVDTLSMSNVTAIIDELEESKEATTLNSDISPGVLESEAKLNNAEAPSETKKGEIEEEAHQAEIGVENIPNEEITETGSIEDSISREKVKDEGSSGLEREAIPVEPLSITIEETLGTSNKENNNEKVSSCEIDNIQTEKERGHEEYEKSFQSNPQGGNRSISDEFPPTDIPGSNKVGENTELVAEGKKPAEGSSLETSEENAGNLIHDETNEQNEDQVIFAANASDLKVSEVTEQHSITEEDHSIIQDPSLEKLQKDLIATKEVQMIGKPLPPLPEVLITNVTKDIEMMPESLKTTAQAETQKQEETNDSNAVPEATNLDSELEFTIDEFKTIKQDSTTIVPVNEPTLDLTQGPPVNNLTNAVEGESLSQLSEVHDGHAIKDVAEKEDSLDPESSNNEKVEIINSGNFAESSDKDEEESDRGESKHMISSKDKDMPLLESGSAAVTDLEEVKHVHPSEADPEQHSTGSAEKGASHDKEETPDSPRAATGLGHGFAEENTHESGDTDSQDQHEGIHVIPHAQESLMRSQEGGVDDVESTHQTAELTVDTLPTSESISAPKVDQLTVFSPKDSEDVSQMQEKIAAEGDRITDEPEETTEKLLPAEMSEESTREKEDHPGETSKTDTQPAGGELKSEDTKVGKEEHSKQKEGISVSEVVFIGDTDLDDNTNNIIATEVKDMSSTVVSNDMILVQLDKEECSETLISREGIEVKADEATVREKENDVEEENKSGSEEPIMGEKDPDNDTSNKIITVEMDGSSNMAMGEKIFPGHSEDQMEAVITSKDRVVKTGETQVEREEQDVLKGKEPVSEALLMNEKDVGGHTIDRCIVAENPEMKDGTSSATPDDKILVQGHPEDNSGNKNYSEDQETNIDQYKAVEEQDIPKEGKPEAEGPLTGEKDPDYHTSNKIPIIEMKEGSPSAEPDHRTLVQEDSEDCTKTVIVSGDEEVKADGGEVETGDQDVQKEKKLDSDVVVMYEKDSVDNRVSVKENSEDTGETVTGREDKGVKSDSKSGVTDTEIEKLIPVNISEAVAESERFESAEEKRSSHDFQELHEALETTLSSKSSQNNQGQDSAEETKLDVAKIESPTPENLHALPHNTGLPTETIMKVDDSDIDISLKNQDKREILPSAAEHQMVVEAELKVTQEPEKEILLLQQKEAAETNQADEKTYEFVELGSEPANSNNEKTTFFETKEGNNLPSEKDTSVVEHFSIEHLSEAKKEEIQTKNTGSAEDTKAVKSPEHKDEEVSDKKEEVHAKNIGRTEDSKAAKSHEHKDEEVKDEKEHSEENSGTDLPVMIEAPRNAEVKVTPKKSHNSLTGVIKHSISKMKKAITCTNAQPMPQSPR